MSPDQAVVEFFNKNWKKMLPSLPKYSKLILDHAPLLEPIVNLDMWVNGRDDEPVVNGWKYVGPGDLVVRIETNLEYILDYPIDHYRFIGDAFIPWLDQAVMKYFGLSVYDDFADIEIIFADLEGSEDIYELSVYDAQTKKFYDHPNKSWVRTNSKNSLKEQKKEKKDVLVLNFPKKGFEMNIMKLAGNIFVSGVFGSINESLDWISENGDNFTKPLKTLVIGAHGNKCSRSIMSTAKDNGKTDESVLLQQLQVNGFIGPNTVVFFTSCFGADDLSKLTYLSQDLGGMRVYGAEGKYNYITSSADGFYSCSFTPQDNQKMWNGSYENWCRIKYGKYIVNDPKLYNEYYLDRGFCRRESSAPYDFF